LNVSNENEFVRQLCSNTAANTSKSSEQPLPLVVEEVRSRFSAVWFKVPQLLITFPFLVVGLEHGAPHDSQRQQLCATFLLSQRLNSKFVFQWNFTHVTDA